MRIPPGEVTGPIAPYLQRAYWGGSVIGEGAAGADYPIRSGEALAEFAITSLEFALAGGARGTPAATYQPGSTFVFEEHQPGTVIIFERESLMLEDRGVPHVNMTAIEEGPLPRPSRLARELRAKKHRDRLAFEPDIFIGGGLGMVYEDQVLYGVVALNSRHEHRLVTIPSTGVVESISKSGSDWNNGKPGKIKVDTGGRLGLGISPKTEKTPITVGEARVHNGNSWRNKRLVRVNALQVIMMGEHLAEAYVHELHSLIHNVCTVYPRLREIVVDMDLAPDYSNSQVTVR